MLIDIQMDGQTNTHIDARTHLKIQKKQSVTGLTDRPIDRQTDRYSDLKVAATKIYHPSRLILLDYYCMNTTEAPKSTSASFSTLKHSPGIT